MNIIEDLSKINRDRDEKWFNVLSQNASKLAEHYDILNEKFIEDAKKASSPDELRLCNTRACAAFIFGDLARYFNENAIFYNESDKRTILDSSFANEDLNQLCLDDIESTLIDIIEMMDSYDYSDAYTSLYNKYVTNECQKEPALFPFVPHKLYGQSKIEDTNLIPQLKKAFRDINQEATENRCKL